MGGKLSVKERKSENISAFEPKSFLFGTANPISNTAFLSIVPIVENEKWTFSKLVLFKLYGHLNKLLM